LIHRAYRYLSALGHKGGAHDTYLALWLNVGVVGLILYFRGLAPILIKATNNTSIALAVLFSLLFSILYESWLAGSLNPYTILLLVILTIMSEEEIIGSLDQQEAEVEALPEEPAAPPVILPAR